MKRSPMARAAILFGLAAAGPLAICAGRLGLDLWYDEAYMLREYVARGPGRVVGDYSEPNNHILYALLLWPVQWLSRADAALRLPNLLFATATLWFTFLAARRVAMRLACERGSPDAAAAAATAALGLNTLFLVHAMQLRGYGLSMALAATLLWLALSRAGTGSPDAASGPVAPDLRALLAAVGRGAAIVAFSAAMLYAIPTNAVALAAMAAAAVANVAMVARKSVAALVEAATWLAGMTAGLALYAPVWDDLRRHAGPRDTGAAWGDFLRVAEIITRDGSWLWAVALLGAVTLLVRTRRGRESAEEGAHAVAQSTKRGRESREPGAGRRLIVLSAILCFAPFIAQASIGLSMPLDRSYCAVLPGVAVVLGVLIHAAVVESLGAIGVARRHNAPKGAHEASAAKGTAAGTTPATEWIALLVVVAALLPSKVTYGQRLASIRDRAFAQDGYYCYFAAEYHPEALVEHLRNTIGPEESYVFLWEQSGNNVFPHYLERAGLPESRAVGEMDRRELSVYYAAPTLAEFEDIARVSGIPEAVLRRFERVRDFGYFGLYRMSGEEVERWMGRQGSAQPGEGRRGERSPVRKGPRARRVRIPWRCRIS